jgi:Icc-related predicted phosphoesterase
MRILVLADVHGEFETTERVIKNIKTTNIDLILCPGDFTDMFNIPEGFSQTDVADIVLQKILSLKKPVYAVPGNHDPYEVLETFNDYNINLHSRVRKAGGVLFVGWGGAPTPFNSIFEPSEDETEEELSRLGKLVAGKPFGLVVHNPPKNTKLDMTDNGKHVGSGAIRDFILKRQPLFAVSAHIHESSGVDVLGKTRLFYPGPVYNGFYGIITLDNSNVRCEIRKADIGK